MVKAMIDSSCLEMIQTIKKRKKPGRKSKGVKNKYTNVKSAPNKPPNNKVYMPLNLVASILNVSGQKIRLRLENISHYKPENCCTMVCLDEARKEMQK